MFNRLIDSHKKVLKDYAQIKRKFQGLSEGVIKQLLAKYYQRFADVVRQFGDGYPLRGIPQDLVIWENPYVMPVIILFYFPQLEEFDSCFDPFAPIASVRYWREKPLIDRINLDGKDYRIVVLIYEIDVGTHGINLNSAKRNQKILSSYGINFDKINKNILRFLESLIAFYNSYGQHILIFTHYQRKNFNFEVQRLLRHPGANHRKVKLTGKNTKLMDIISGALRSWAHFPSIFYLKKENKEEILKKKYGPQGESSEHKKLKDWIMAHPENIGISDANVVYRNKEQTFLHTGDLADVYFELADGKYVVVEIETTNPFPGAFQALKYKILKCAELGIDIKSDRVIPILVAW